MGATANSNSTIKTPQCRLFLFKAVFNVCYSLFAGNCHQHLRLF
jgi:hypothetical protein